MVRCLRFSLAPFCPYRFSLDRSVRNSRVARTYSTSPPSAHVDEPLNQRLIRNVGVIAHIDAGKTTTTERMLYFAHRTHRIGEVDRGDTVTDYLPEERERGISIVSAAACLSWRQHTLHLIDTPGHVDFTMEVERSLTVVDGAVTILDGTKGVQAQTRTVWHQADRYNLPRLVFVNKMDRETANFVQSVGSLSTELASSFRYVPIHWPIFRSDLISDQPPSTNNAAGVPFDRFVGLVDLTTMQLQNWSACNSPESEPTSINLWHPDRHGHLYLSPKALDQVMQARSSLLNQLADVDETLADEYLALDHPETLLSDESVQAAVRRGTHSSQIVPVLLGSSRKNVGIQPLLNAIVDYLPDPSSRPLPAAVSQVVQSHQFKNRVPRHTTTSPSLPVMLVFKIAFDHHWGPLTLVRIYAGSVKRDSPVTNWSRHQTAPAVEKIHAVLQLTGDYHERVDSASAGSIVALAGLKSTHSGDILGPVLLEPKQTTESQHLSDEDTTLPEPVRYEPVVYAALEPNSLSDVKNMEHALLCMQREDPSFVAKLNPETGQWIVGGMGDLHLEILQSRLQREHKMNARLGPLLIAYKECPGFSVLPRQHDNRTTVGFGHCVATVDGSRKAASAIVSLEPSGHFKPQVSFDRSWFLHGDSLASHHSFVARLQHAIRAGCLSALQSAGPLLRSPVAFVNVHVQRLVVGQPERIPSSVDMVADLAELHATTEVPHSHHLPSAAYQALCRSTVLSALNDCIKAVPDWRLLEPMMSVELRLPMNSGCQTESLSQFLSDLSSRRGEILSVDAPDSYTEPDDDSSKQQPPNFSHHVIHALAPLSELVGYSATVRTLSSGRADLQVAVSDYRPVSMEHQNHLLNKFRWSPTSSFSM